MRKTILLLVYSFFCVMLLSVVTRAQNSLTHNTGTLEVTTIENGYIGDNYSGTYGGVVFNGNQNVMAMAGIIFGQNGEAHGNYGVIFEDFYNIIPIAGFDSTQYFNQYANYTLAFTGEPDSRTIIESFSNVGHDFVFLKAIISDSTNYIDDFYPGIFADWDIGNYSTNRGGYIPSMNLFYMYENGGSTDTSYYGIMGIAVDGLPMSENTMKGVITDSIAWNGWDFYNLMTSAAFDTITTDGDYRMYTCLGPYSFPAGSTLSVVIAIVAGTSLDDLLANAQAAIEYGPYTPVEQTTITELDFTLDQNYPNPFNPSTTIKYHIPELSFVTIKVYDVLGSEVVTLINEEKPVGTYELGWDAESAAGGLPSGVYFYRLQAGDFIQTRKMILLK